MGQEASVPTDGRNGIEGFDASLEEQAKAPPSAIHPPSSASINHNQQPQQHSSQQFLSSKDGSKRKLHIPNMLFQRSTGATTTISTAKDPHHPHDIESFEQREAARAAAAGGNLYQQQLSDETLTYDSNNNDDDDDRYALQKMPSQPMNEAVYGNTSATTTTAYPLSGGGGVAAGDGAISDTGATNLANASSSSKKSLFPTRASARGMINTMRNLSIGNALRKPKEVNDWEKQWDEDDDDSDDGEEDEMVDGGAVRSNASMLRPDLASNSSSRLSVPPPPPGTAAAAAMAANEPMPKSPPRHQSFLHFPKIASPQKPSAHQQQQQPVDLLSSSLASASISPQRHPQNQQQFGSSVDVWETPDLLTHQQQALDVRKPDVDMFLPVLRVLGKGSFGKVVLVQKREGKERGQLFAMKILRKTHLVKRRQIERTRTERKVLSVVNHPFIMKLHYAFQTPDKLYLILDYCPGGELFFHLSRFRRFPERVARFYAAELLLAIGHLHKRGIIYRDLKPENVLLDADGHVKLGDFGLAKAGIQHPYEGASSMCGTPEYMAPEVLAQQGHGFCVDYWGLGMILYEMMTGLPPWYTTDRAQLFRRLKSAPLDIPQYFSESSADCVIALLERNPRRRLGVTGIRTAMEHPFFRNISWRALYSRRVEAPVRPCEGWKPPDPVAEDDLLSGHAQESSQFYPDGMAKLDSNTLDTATQNFDSQFTRMPVESEDQSSHDLPGDELTEELDENTFLGFSFDIVKEREKAAMTNGTDGGQNANAASRHRTQNYHTGLDQQEQL